MRWFAQLKALNARLDGMLRSEDGAVGGSGSHSDADRRTRRRLENGESENNRPDSDSKQGVGGEKHDLRFLVPLLDVVDAFDPSIVRKRQYDNNIDDEYTGRVALNFMKFVIEISHVKEVYSVLFSESVKLFLESNGFLSYNASVPEIRVSETEVYILKYYSRAQNTRSYATYQYEPGDANLVEVKTKILRVLGYVFNVLKKAADPTPEMISEQEADAEYTEFMIYDSEVHENDRNHMGVGPRITPVSYAAWASTREVMRQRAIRNLIRRRNGWPEDDGTSENRGKLSNPPP